MSLGHAAFLRLAIVGLVASLTMTSATWDHADARSAKKSHAAGHAGKSGKVGKNRSRVAFTGWTRYAAIVVDDKSGEVLHETKADEPRHPASITKIMTLYLLFEQLEAGHLKLDSQMPISAYAASRPPTKLGLKVGQTLKVEDAIMGLVTRSANDAASVIAEAVGGSEEDFARLMTRKAIALGMSSTIYVNASGLPADLQITTARDQAVLGRAIQHRFPQYFTYFATPSFRFRKQEIRNHNGLLGNVKGVDGIKTGYTHASGYNLVTSVKRDDRQVVAVVLGGPSNGARDNRMRELIEEYLPKASVERSAPILTELGPNGAPVTAAVAPDLVAPTLASERSVPIELIATNIIPGKANYRTDVPPSERDDAPPGSKEDLERKAEKAKQAEKEKAGGKGGKASKAAKADKDPPRRSRRSAGNAANSDADAKPAVRSRHAERRAGRAARQQ
jgi:D-alanyl-D-alanine carboxypeptidase